MSANTSSAPSISARRPRVATGLFGHVVDELGQEIVNGDLAAGSIVFAEQLCERFGVSRSVMRECLRALSSMGLVEGRPHVGTRVLPASDWDLLSPQVVKWRSQSTHYVDQMRQLLELRLGVEQSAARLAAERIDPDDAESMRAATADMAEALDANDSRRYFEADARFHRLLLEGTGNPVIAQLAGTIGAALQVRRHDLRPGMHDMSRQSVDRHIELAEALRSREADDAQRAAFSLVAETLREFEALQAPISGTSK